MSKKKNITIAGNLGSGKSSAANGVAKQLGYSRFSSGDFFRQIGKEMGLSLKELSKLAEVDPTIDERTDQKVREMRDREDVVIDSRLAFHWIPESFKVYLKCGSEEAHKRMMKDLETNDLRQQTEHSVTHEEQLQKMIERAESEKIRYKAKYGIDNEDMSPYDLVVDTEKNDLDSVVRMIITMYFVWRKE